jgi:hypothetical protein
LKEAGGPANGLNNSGTSSAPSGENFMQTSTATRKKHLDMLQRFMFLSGHDQSVENASQVRAIEPKRTN